MTTLRVTKPSRGGRPAVLLDDEKIAALHAEGLGPRAIAGVLSEGREEGPVSHMTVWRRVKALELRK